jgi:hypothetical protein
MVMVYKSKYTPNAKATEILFQIGEKVTYQLLDGSNIEVEIATGPRSHSRCKTYGYEVISKSQTIFIDSERIVNWEGKNSLP